MDGGRRAAFSRGLGSAKVQGRFGEGSGKGRSLLSRVPPRRARPRRASLTWQVPEGNLNLTLPQPDRYLAEDSSFLNSNVTVTATTEFLALWQHETPCNVSITHMRASSGAAHRRRRSVPPEHEPTADGASRVRIDSLHVRAGTWGNLAYELHHAGYSKRTKMLHILNSSEAVCYWEKPLSLEARAPPQPRASDSR